MQPDTRNQLIRLTDQFYQHHAESFSATRISAWQGWQTLIPFFQDTASPNVLDVGCGNGRFAQFLSEHISSFTYTGLDKSASLIDTARQLVSANNCQFLNFDSFGETPAPPTAAAYSHLVLFGVLHHLPGKSYRLSYLTQLSKLLRPGGYLIVSFWQPLQELARFSKKQLNPVQFGVDPAQLEPGDILLGWQNNTEYARYCHSFTDQEISDYITTMSSLRLIERYIADGKANNLNQYVIWQKQEESDQFKTRGAQTGESVI